ncbi:MAG: chloride channel protein, partial [Actinomycetospora chiangmaiensis]|nr:chloride channel protein [Actinomycetospora chiangmaiensis]
MDGRIEMARGGDGPRRRTLGDFSADRRVLTLAGMAVITGTAASATAWILLTLIGLVTNLVWFGRFDTALTSLAGATPGPGMVVIPVFGALVVGAMA